MLLKNTCTSLHLSLIIINALLFSGCRESTEGEGKSSKARKMVEYYLEADEEVPVIIPKGIDPEVLDSVIRDKIHADSASFKVWRTCELVCFYGLRRSQDHFIAFMDHGDFSNAAAAVVMIGYTGDNEHKRRVKDYFARELITHKEAVRNIPVLLKCYTSLGPGDSFFDISNLCRDRLVTIERDSEKSDEKYIESQNLKRILSDELPRVENALKVRDEIIRLDIQERLKRIIYIYCELEVAHKKYLFKWSAYELLREAEKGKIQRDKIISVIREVIEEIDDNSKIEEKNRLFFRSRLLRAIEYFDQDKLTAEEKNVCKAALERGQDDLISTAQPDI